MKSNICERMLIESINLSQQKKINEISEILKNIKKLKR